MIINKTKKLTLRKLMVSEFDDLNKRIDPIDKRLSNVENNIKDIKKAPLWKKS